MTYINLTGDSDGDLHTAAMHNAKFGAIASVLNGNIDANNLAAPQSYLTWTLGTAYTAVVTSGGGAANTGVGSADTFLLTTGTDPTVGPLSAADYVTAQAANNYLLLADSYRKAPADLTHVATNAIVYRYPSGGSGTFELIFQKASAITGTYENFATGTFNLTASGSVMEPTEISMSGSYTLSPNDYFRVLYRVPPGGYPSSTGDLDIPLLKIQLTFKALHVA